MITRAHQNKVNQHLHKPERPQTTPYQYHYKGLIQNGTKWWPFNKSVAIYLYVYLDIKLHDTTCACASWCVSLLFLLRRARKSLVDTCPRKSMVGSLPVTLSEDPTRWLVQPPALLALNVQPLVAASNVKSQVEILLRNSGENNEERSRQAIRNGYDDDTTWHVYHACQLSAANEQAHSSMLFSQSIPKTRT